MARQLAGLCRSYLFLFMSKAQVLTEDILVAESLGHGISYLLVGGHAVLPLWGRLCSFSIKTLELVNLMIR